MCSSPSLKDFSVIAIVVLICSCKSAGDLPRFGRFSVTRPCFVLSSSITWDSQLMGKGELWGPAMHYVVFDGR